MMAVRVLLVGGAPLFTNPPHPQGTCIPRADHFSWVCFHFQDHDVQEDKILLVSLLMAEMGVHSVAYAFPQVKIITTAVDKKVNDLFHIIPGIGEGCWESRRFILIHFYICFIFFYRFHLCCLVFQETLEIGILEQMRRLTGAMKTWMSPVTKLLFKGFGAVLLDNMKILRLALYGR